MSLYLKWLLVHLNWFTTITCLLLLTLNLLLPQLLYVQLHFLPCRRIVLQAVQLLDMAQVSWCWLMLDGVVVV
jgi:hypothetical protein